MTTFEKGKIYYMRSPGDHECMWFYMVEKRTAKTITVSDGKETKTLRISKVSEMTGAETVHPLGVYSMAPSLSADHSL